MCHLWSYIILWICFSVFTNAENMMKSENRSFRKPRMNSKFTKEFQNTTFPQWDQILRKFLKQNETIDSNEIPDDMDPKIVNGRPVNEGEFPWMVALHFNDRFICSSFLISPTIVMTAAHCVKFNDGVEPATAFYGIIGNIRREGPETRIQFSEVAAHPQYGSGSEYDIAVLRVSSPVAMDERIQQICLPQKDRNFDLVYIQAMGWGVTSDMNQEPPETMMTTELSVPPRNACKFFYALLGITITDRHICVNSFRPTGVCYGDSGGPAVFDDVTGGKPVAVGVASFISFLGCGRPIAPSVYTRIATYIDWLTETVGDTNDICFV